MEKEKTAEDFDLFLDNIVKGASNEELMKMQQKRKPASVQSENVVSVSDEPVRPIDVGGSGYKFKIPETKLILENTNRAIEQRQADAQGLAMNSQDIAKDVDNNKFQINDVIQRLQKVGTGKYQEDPRLTEQIDNASKNLDSAKVPEQDMMSHAILSLAPALFGSVMGESGAISQVAGGEKARSIYNNIHKEGVESANKKNELALKRYNELVKIRQAAPENFSKNQQLELDKIRTEFAAVSALLGHNAKDLDKTQTMINQIGEENSKSIQAGAKTVAEMEDGPRLAKEKEKRANIIASGSGLKDATNLRKEYLNLPEVKTFAEVKAAFGKIDEIIKRNSPGGDMSLIFNYMKMLDPGSTVREGEQAQVEQARGVPEDIRARYNKLVSGDKLTQTQRNDYHSRAADLFNAQQKIVSQRESEYRSLGSSYGTNSNLVVPNLSKPVSVKGAYKEGDIKEIGTTKFIFKNGKWVQ